MSKFDQNKVPFIEALDYYAKQDIVPFDVPGHHMGNIKNPATELLGTPLYRLDVNAPIGLDNLAKPHGVILEAEQYLAEATNADDAFFLINGTSSGIIAMLLTACKAGEKIILPRNVHKSIVNGLILSGAVPVYVMPEIDDDLEISNQPTIESYRKAILKHPSAKAVFVINPTYFGAVSDLKAIVELAHQHNMAVLVDEAHGAHYYFHAKGSPMTAMDAGADLSAVSIHKTAGSLTQTSVLLSKNGRYSRYEIQKALNILNSTSPSSLLIASLDGARSFMATKGKKAQEDTYELAHYAIEQINKIPGFYVAGKEHFLSRGCFDYDESKLVLGFDRLDIDGFDLYQLGMKDYQIQFELAETYAVLCIMAIGTKKEHVDRLIAALKDVSKKHFHPEIRYKGHRFDTSFPFALLRPRAAFNATGKLVPLEECVNQISKEMVMIYPPGIPFICPGEIWDKELVARMKRYIKNGCTVLSTYPDKLEIVDTENWKRFPFYRKKYEDYLQNRKTTPSNDGFAMPFEGEAHKATVMLLPFRADTWRNKGIPGRKAYKEVAMAIAEHEEVILGIHPSIYGKVIDEFSDLKNITPIKIRYNDSWARDTIGLFVTNGKTVRSVDFRFNAWGGEVDGLYSNYKDDDRLASLFAKRYKYIDYQHPSFIFEGGSIAVDGEGSAIVTEACLLSEGRNPTLSKEEIEETIHEYLGIDKLIWVPHGIYEDETNEHIDNMVAYIRPGEVAMAWCENKNDPQYDFCQQTYQALQEATDAKGRKLVIHKIVLPSSPLTMTEEESRGVQKGHFAAKPRLGENRLAASYINFYQGKDFVVMPGFGVKEDGIAKAQIQALYPEKKIHQVQTREILLGGGNIHCITMQIPEE